MIVPIGYLNEALRLAEKTHEDIHELKQEKNWMEITFKDDGQTK